MSLNHTLSIWLEIEFTSNIYFKHQFALINNKIFMKTIRINIFKTTTLRISFIYVYIFFLFFFCTSKNLVLDLYQVKIMCNADFKILYSNKLHSVTRSEIFYVKNLSMIANVFLMNVEKNTLKKLP